MKNLIIIPLLTVSVLSFSQEKPKPSTKPKVTGGKVLEEQQQKAEKVKQAPSTSPKKPAPPVSIEEDKGKEPREGDIKQNKKGPPSHAPAWGKRRKEGTTDEYKGEKNKEWKKKKEHSKDKGHKKEADKDDNR